MMTASVGITISSSNSYRLQSFISIEGCDTALTVAFNLNHTSFAILAKMMWRTEGEWR